MTEQEKNEELRAYLELWAYRRFRKAMNQSINPLLNSLKESNSIGFTYALQAMLYDPMPIDSAITEFYEFAWWSQSSAFVRWANTNYNAGLIDRDPIVIREFNAYYNSIGVEHSKIINDTSRRRIDEAFQQAFANDETVEEFQKRLVNEVQMNKTRARIISRTESVMLLNRVMIEQAKLLPFEVNKVWVHDHPLTPRNWHLALSGTKKPLMIPFDVEGIPMQYPGDPIGGAYNNIGCKCSLVIVPV
jgi:hypothetical protein